MQDRIFDRLVEQGFLARTNQVYMFGNAGCNIFKAKDKQTRDALIDSFVEKGAEIQKVERDNLYCIFFAGYLIGCII